MKILYPSAIHIQRSEFSRIVVFFLMFAVNFGLATAEERNDGQVENVFDHQQVENIKITIQDDAQLHVHPQGKPFSIHVKVDSPFPAKIYCQWYDYRGYPLSEPIKLISGSFINVISPSSKVGYYGLVFKSSDHRLAFSNRQIGENREYGFTIIESRAESARLIGASSPFGVVHARLYDPFLPPWIKTLTWKTFSAKHWTQQIEKRQQLLGFFELPMIVGDVWDSDDAEVVPPEQLEALGSRIKKYFEAHPNVLYWELGREENIKKRFKKAHYWGNLEKKVRTVREAAKGVNPNIKLIYQVAGLKKKSVKKFSESNAAKTFDILSLHPYAWPNFIDPEEWLVDYLENIRRIMKEHELEHMPIWFTEVGAPHQGNYEGGFFGYPKSGRSVTGLTRREAVSYMIKLHILSLALGVEKVFWYNYKDRRQGREEAENHFGLIDFWGYPKPIYAAYLNLFHRVNGKQFSRSWSLPGGLQVYEFKGNNETVLVSWIYPKGNQSISWSRLRQENEGGQIVDVVDAVGTRLFSDKTMIQITNEPTFITTRRFKHFSDDSVSQ